MANKRRKKPKRHQRRSRAERKIREQRRADRKMADMLAATIIPTLYKLLQAYPLGSRKNQVCLNVLRLMTFAWPPQQPRLIPAAIMALARQDKTHG